MTLIRKLGENLFLSLVGRRYLRSRSPDCFVISFRKSGRTWLRMMVAKAFALYYKCTKEYIFCPEELVRRGYMKAPFVDFTHADEMFNDESWMARYRDKKNVLLVRDPRDVLVSYYYHVNQRDNIHIEMKDLVRHPDFGIDRIIYFMNEWYENRNISSQFYIVRYEDLKSDTFTELKQLLLFAGLSDITDAIVDEAIGYASIDNMRALSVTYLKKEKRLAPADPNNPESFKVRKGRVGEFKKCLAAHDLEYVNKKITSDLHPVFRYSL